MPALVAAQEYVFPISLERQFAVSIVALEFPRGGISQGRQWRLVDGSVRFVAETIELVTWQALATRAGGEVIGNY